jgi:hypothetical protein
MNAPPRLVAVALIVAASALAHAPASARGGGPANIINSEGYQRALREERRQYQQAPSQVLAPASAPRQGHRKHHH